MYCFSPNIQEHFSFKKIFFQGYWSFTFQTIALKTFTFFIISSFYLNIASIFKNKNEAFKISKDFWTPEAALQGRTSKVYFPYSLLWEWPSFQEACGPPLAERVAEDRHEVLLHFWGFFGGVACMYSFILPFVTLKPGELF